MDNQTSNVGAQASLQPVILQSACSSTARGNVSIVATKCLGIFQVINGFLLLGVGIIFLALEDRKDSLYSRYDGENNYHYSGVAGVISAVLAIIAGILGLQSVKYPKNYFKSGINLGFCIAACVAGGTSVGIYSAGVGIFRERRPYDHYGYRYHYYWPYKRDSNYTKEIALSAVLLVLAVIELFIALAASIYGCQFACCGKEGCCRSSTKVIMMAQPDELFRMTNTIGQPTGPLEYSANSGLPPPYCVNEGDCSNATYENVAEHNQSM